MIWTLQQLADQGKLRNRDIDIIMVAAGFLSYEVVEEYLAHRDGQAASAPERPRLIDSDVVRFGAMKRAVLRNRSLPVLDP